MSVVLGKSVSSQGFPGDVENSSLSSCGLSEPSLSYFCDLCPGCHHHILVFFHSLFYLIVLLEQIYQESESVTTQLHWVSDRDFKSDIALALYSTLNNNIQTLDVRHCSLSWDPHRSRTFSISTTEPGSSHGTKESRIVSWNLQWSRITLINTSLCVRTV